MDEIPHISDELIAKYLDGRATEEESGAIRAYIEAHPEEMAWLSAAARDVSFQDCASERHPGVYHRSLIDKSLWDDDTRYAIAGRGKVAIAANSDDNHSCAIKAQQLILSDYGKYVSVGELTRVARQNGWYIDQMGSPFDFVGELLNYYNVPAVQMRNANVYHLIHELSQGHRIIVGVDDNDLKQSRCWQEFDDQMFGKEANHVLLVAGIQTSADQPAQIVLSDPSRPENTKVVSMQQFVAAWEDSGYFMVATTQPAPLEHNPGMQYFDYDKGHLQQFADLAYTEIVRRLAQDGYMKKNDLKKRRIRIVLSILSSIFITVVGVFCWIFFSPFNMCVSLSENPDYRIPNLPLEEGSLSINYDEGGDKVFMVSDKQNNVILPSIPHRYKNKKAHIRFEAAGFVTIDTLVRMGKTIDLCYRHDDGLSKIFGVVIDSRDGRCLAGVTVKVQNLAAITDDAGCFSISIPYSQQKQEQQVSAFKKGHTMWLGTYEPSATTPWHIVLEAQ